MVPVQPPRGMSSKSGTVTAYLTRTLSPGLNRGDVVGLLGLVMGTLASDTRRRRGPVPATLPTIRLSPPLFLASNEFDRLDHRAPTWSPRRSYQFFHGNSQFSPSERRPRPGL